MVNTRNMEDFGYREREMAAELLEASIKQGFPDDFEYDGIAIEFNPESGEVFFVNSEYQVAMMNGDKLESWYFTPYEGHEGFKDELRELDRESLHPDDLEYLIDIGVFEPDEDEED